jgi:hypothetical protein
MVWTLDDLNLLSWAMQAGPPARLQFAGVGHGWCSPRRASDGVAVGIRSRKKEDSDGWSRPGLRWACSRGKDSGLWADTDFFSARAAGLGSAK